jgi:hypothetical protein
MHRTDLQILAGNLVQVNSLEPVQPVKSAEKVPEKILPVVPLAATYEIVLFGSRSTHSVKLPCALDSNLQDLGPGINGTKL